MAATISRQETGAPGGPPGHKQKEKTMIFHINRMAFKSGLSEEQRRACLDAVRQAGAANPAVRSYVVGPELGGEFEYGAVYVVEDLDGYWAYLTHPAHVRSEREGIPLIEKFVAIDVSDSDDPELGEKIAALQARNYQEHPEMAALVAQAASFTVPDGTGPAA
jgi:dienelactone hydrolase